MPPWKADEHWTDFECLAAIWGYYQIEKLGRDANPIIMDVVKLTGRTKHAVEKKLGNIAALDAAPSAGNGIRVWEHGQKKLRPLYAMTEGGRSLSLSALESGIALDPFGLFDGGKVPIRRGSSGILVEEGAWEKCSGKRRKRSEALRNEARAYFRDLNPDGILRCHCCGVGFGEVNGREIIEIHHLRPISDYSQTRATGIDEAIRNTIPLCPTCHSLAHTRRPPLEPREIMDIVSIR